MKINSYPNKRERASTINTQARPSKDQTYKLRQHLPRILRRPNPQVDRSLPHGYLSDAFKTLDEAEASLKSNPKQRLKIDGGKDRARWLRDIPTLFTEDFKVRLKSYFPSGDDSTSQIEEIILRNRTSLAQSHKSQNIDRSLEESSPIVRRSGIRDYEIDLDGHLNYEYSGEHQREWRRRLLTLPTKDSISVEVQMQPSANEQQNRVHVNRTPPKRTNKEYMFKSLALSRVN